MQFVRLPFLLAVCFTASFTLFSSHAFSAPDEPQQQNQPAESLQPTPSDTQPDTNASSQNGLYLSLKTSTFHPHKIDPLPIVETDLWTRLRLGYGIPDLENDLVTKQEAWYGARVSYVQRTSQRASRYLFHVIEELEKRGMPTELALLPFIESSFNPEAMSSAKASGMWQFIPSTGKDYNLKQTLFHDERRSVLDSTDAALSYLQKLYDMFGDWQLALAAYNWGEGSVQRAIKKQRAAGLPIDYKSMSYLMPAETQNYVPKLQAVKNIISHPELFNLTLPKIDNQPYFVSIDKTRDMDVAIAAQLAGLSLAEFKELNPQFNRPVITGTTDTKILLPAGNVDLFHTNLSNYDGPLSNWTTYNVIKTEKIESIAKRLGAQVNVLKTVNQVPANMLIKAGSTLLIPKSSVAALSTHEANKANHDIAPSVIDNASLTLTHANTKHIVVTTTKKDTLATLSKRYKVTIAQIKEWNNLSSDKVKTGQKLQLDVAATPKRVAHTTKNSGAKKASQGKQTKVAAANPKGHNKSGH